MHRIEDYSIEALNLSSGWLTSVREYRVDHINLRGRQVVKISYWTGIGLGEPVVSITATVGAVGTATAALVAVSTTAAAAAAAAATASTLAGVAMAAEGATLLSASTAAVAATNTAAAAATTASTAVVAAWVLVPTAVVSVVVFGGSGIYNASQDWKYAYFDENSNRYLGQSQDDVIHNLGGNGELEIDYYYHPFEYDDYFNKYYSEGIDLILKLRLVEIGKQNDIGLIPAGYMFDDSSSHINFEEIATKVTEMANDIICLPYNLYGKHWVGIIFERNSENTMKVTYINTEGNIILDILENGIRLAFKELGYNIDIFNMFIEEKQLAGNCGPEVIENFIKYLTGDRISQEEAVPYHSELVEAELLGQDIMEI